MRMMSALAATQCFMNPWPEGAGAFDRPVNDGKVSGVSGRGAAGEGFACKKNA